jgi:hypothetical protein
MVTRKKLKAIGFLRSKISELLIVLKFASRLEIPRSSISQTPLYILAPSFR